MLCVLCVLCLQPILRLPSGGLSTLYVTDHDGRSIRVAERGGVSCPTTIGEIEGHRQPFAATA